MLQEGGEQSAAFHYLPSHPHMLLTHKHQHSQEQAVFKCIIYWDETLCETLNKHKNQNNYHYFSFPSEEKNPSDI